MKPEIKISSISRKTTSQQSDNCYAVLWIQNKVEGIEINKTLYKNVSNAVFFLNPAFHWKVLKKDISTSSGYVLLIPRHVLNHPSFKNLHITEVRLFSANEIPKINLSPGIEVRIQSILEMLDELLSTKLKHWEDAILALLKTFFVYCDGQCNIRSVITDNNNAKSNLVYRFKKSIDQYITQCHEVAYYANMLNVSDKYLNECVKDVLGVKAKHLIKEQLVLRSRHNLKFTNKTIKEVGYELGFSSPNYFSYFVKKHTGYTPTQLRKS